MYSGSSDKGTTAIQWTLHIPKMYRANAFSTYEKWTAFLQKTKWCVIYSEVPLYVQYSTVQYSICSALCPCNKVSSLITFIAYYINTSCTTTICSS